MTTTQTNEFPEKPEKNGPNWALNAPRGGKAVLNRILKDNASVPLFFAQTLIQSLRDVGYNNTTAALCEHVDNSIQAGATQVRVFFRQHGKKGEYEIDAAVFDDGRGMSPNVLKVATSFGGSMNYGARQGIARFGMGMKTAALSMSPVMELYSWQETSAYYNMTLDVEAIGRERTNLVELPDPSLLTELPDEISELFTKPMSFPSNASEQSLLAPKGVDLDERLGEAGTIVYMPKCDRLTYAKAQTLVESATREMARVYRRAIALGLKLYVNNRRVDAFDPTYSLSTARHVRFLDSEAKTSRLIVSKKVDIRISPKSEATAPVRVQIYRLPIEDWGNLPRKVLRNDLRVFDNLTVSILRNDREVFAGPLPAITTRHSVTNWYRVQIDFPGVLDEAFGVAANKQGVRMKEYVLETINEEISGDITTLNDELKRFQSAQAATRKASEPSAAETKANDADPFQGTSLEEGLSTEQEEQLEANLRGFAVTLKRDDETDEQAYERVLRSKYIIRFHYDQYWPFYRVDHQFGRVVLTINTAHPFFSKLYEPLTKPRVSENEDSEDVESESAGNSEALLALELLLLSLARTQSRMSASSDDTRKVLEVLQREWSETYRVQLST